MLPIVMAYAVAESPISAGSSFPILSSEIAPKRISVCAGSPLAGKRVVALMFRRDGGSYSRVAIIRARVEESANTCPVQELQLDIPPLQRGALYVIGLYTSPSAPQSFGSSEPATTGDAQRLEPILYFGLSTAP
jgi:hypothetical protein